MRVFFSKVTHARCLFVRLILNKSQNFDFYSCLRFSRNRGLEKNACVINNYLINCFNVRFLDNLPGSMFFALILMSIVCANKLVESLKKARVFAACSSLKSAWFAAIRSYFLWLLIIDRKQFRWSFCANNLFIIDIDSVCNQFTQARKVKL